MTTLIRLMLIVTAAIVSALSAQTMPKRTFPQIQASYDAHQHEFDYLLGDWEFTSTSKRSGSGKGYWSAVRLATGQIMDEFRVVGEHGETYYASTTLRSYNANTDRWELVTMVREGGLQDVGTGQKRGSEMHIEQKFGVMSEHPTVLRIRYHNIQADRFSWTADLSADDGATWSKDEKRIEARRIGPARSLAPLSHSAIGK